MRRAIEASGLLHGLTSVQMASLTLQCKAVALESGEFVCRRGEPRERLWVLASGALEVVARAGDSEAVSRRIEAQGQLLDGEVIRRGEPGGCLEAVRACEPSLLVMMESGACEQVLRALLESPVAAPPAAGLQRVAGGFANPSSAMRALADLGEEGIRLEVPSGEAVFREGDRARMIYVILEGAAEVRRRHVGDGERALLRLGVGQTFGVSSVLHGHPRAATIVATEPLVLWGVDGARFIRATSHSEALYRYARAFRRARRIIGPGSTLVGACQEGRANVVAWTQGRGGGGVISTVAADGVFFGASRDDEGLMRGSREDTFRDEGRAIRRRLWTRDGVPLAFEAEGPWRALEELHRCLLEEKALGPGALERFVRTGELFGPEPTPRGPGEVLCHCLNLTRAEIMVHVERGCDSVQDIRERCGAGGECGGCSGHLMELTGSLGALMKLAGRTRLTEDVWSFRFAPLVPTALSPGLPGQHVVVAAEVGGETVTRSYTLTSHGAATRLREITVKREAHGLFSRWLFDAPIGTLVQMSEPQGRFHLEPGATRPVVCLVAGVGVTPAIAIVRASGGARREVLIDYSVTLESEAVALDALDGVGDAPGFECHLRITSRGERLTPAGIEALVGARPSASYFICGPEGFQTMAEEALRACGVPPERVQVEKFTVSSEAPQAAPVERTWIDWFGSAWALVGVLAYVLQRGSGWGLERLVELQQQFNYALGSGLLLAAFLLFQWWLPGQRLLGSGAPGARVQALHRRVGWFAPWFFAAHSLDPGHGMLLFLSSVFLLNVLVGVFDKTVWRSAEVRLRYHRLWLAAHVVLSIIVLVFAGFHAYTALAFKGVE